MLATENIEERWDSDEVEQDGAGIARNYGVNTPPVLIQSTLPSNEVR